MSPELRRHLTCLTVALRACDDVAALIAAARLRRVAGDDAIARVLLAAVPAHVATDPSDRLARWLGMASHSAAELDVPRASSELRAVEPPLDLERWLVASEGAIDLFELDAVERDLALARFADLHLASCVFWSGFLAGAVFDGAHLARCELGRATLARTSWERARSIECSFAGASLVDASLDHASFIDCDLRGADLGVRRTRARAEHTAFIRCDLRDTSWDLRCLDSVELVDCKLDGSYGRGGRGGRRG